MQYIPWTTDPKQSDLQAVALRDAKKGEPKLGPKRGVKSAEERDEELKRQAVDVDVDDDDAPETKRPRPDVHTGLLGIETSLRCPISTGLLVNPLKARPCGHVYSKASAMSYFKGVGKRCAVFGCDKHLKWSDFVVDEASELALREYYRRQARTRQDADGHPYGQLM